MDLAGSIHDNEFFRVTQGGTFWTPRRRAASLGDFGLAKQDPGIGARAS
jgi:hypothetical protein